MLLQLGGSPGNRCPAAGRPPTAAAHLREGRFAVGVGSRAGFHTSASGFGFMVMAVRPVGLVARHIYSIGCYQSVCVGQRGAPIRVAKFEAVPNIGPRIHYVHPIRHVFFRPPLPPPPQAPTSAWRVRMAPMRVYTPCCVVSCDASAKMRHTWSNTVHVWPAMGRTRRRSWPTVIRGIDHKRHDVSGDSVSMLRGATYAMLRNKHSGTNAARMLPNCSASRPHSAEIRPNMVEVGRVQAKLGHTLGNFGRTRPNLTRHPSNLHRFDSVQPECGQ